MIENDRPAAVFLGGDLLPLEVLRAARAGTSHVDFVSEFLAREFAALRASMSESYPTIFLILGNDDPRSQEAPILDGDSQELWTYAHQRKIAFGNYTVYGYGCVPPTPFLLKDWERYDVSRYVDPGCVSPQDGYRTVDVPSDAILYGTIGKDLADLSGSDDLERAIFLFHTPPHRTKLDRAALDGRTIDRVPVDVHVGSIAVRRFIETRQPLVTLHGHIHESARLTGSWTDRIGRTHAFSAAHDGPELCLVRFDPAHPEAATRDLI